LNLGVKGFAEASPPFECRAGASIGVSTPLDAQSEEIDTTEQPASLSLVPDCSGDVLESRPAEPALRHPTTNEELARGLSSAVRGQSVMTPVSLDPT
jgi:hypothetical protein